MDALIVGDVLVEPAGVDACKVSTVLSAGKQRALSLSVAGPTSRIREAFALGINMGAQQLGVPPTVAKDLEAFDLTLVRADGLDLLADYVIELG